MEIYNYFANNQVELWGTIFGIIFVILNIKEKIWAWPVGIINAALYTVVYWNARLYGDFGLSVIYVVLSFYGWYNWLYGGSEKMVLPIKFSSISSLIQIISGGIIASIALGYAFQKYTDNTFPYGDAVTTIFSLIAQWQLTQKRIENWLVWVLVNIIASIIYYHKALYMTTGLYTLYLLLAIVGYFQWRKIYRQQTSIS